VRKKRRAKRIANDGDTNDDATVDARRVDVGL